MPAPAGTHMLGLLARPERAGGPMPWAPEGAQGIDPHKSAFGLLSRLRRDSQSPHTGANREPPYKGGTPI